MPYTRLNQIYRQSSGNTIVDSAYAINRGEMPKLDSLVMSFLLYLLTLYDMMMKAIIDVYKREQEHIEDELDIQIISPMRRGEAGSTLISVCTTSS